MAGRHTDTAAGGLALLERAIGYTLGSLRLVTDRAMADPTPCRGWDLRTLLAHMNDSLLALHEAIATGTVELAESEVDPGREPVAALRHRACELLGGWNQAVRPGVVTVGDRPLATRIVAGTGALEITVHGWDVARACGRDRPLPTALADELLELAPHVVTAADRPARFATPVPVSQAATAEARLLAFLGRVPYGPAHHT